MNTQNQTTAHTPGPWHVEHHIGDWFLITPRNHIIAETASTSVAPTYSQQSANARLIAAAPELLEALEDALNTIKALDEDYDERGSYRRGEAAIAKAKGEQP